MRRNVLDEGAVGRRCRRAVGHLSRARDAARQGRRDVGLGDRLRSGAGRAAATAEGAAAADRAGRRAGVEIVIARAVAAFAVVGLAAAIAGCGERPHVITYKQGTYQGKPDTRPWDNPVFKGDQKAWELALKDRAQT